MRLPATRWLGVSTTRAPPPNPPGKFSFWLQISWTDSHCAAVHIIWEPLEAVYRDECIVVLGNACCKTHSVRQRRLPAPASPALPGPAQRGAAVPGALQSPACSKLVFLFVDPIEYVRTRLPPPSQTVTSLFLLLPAFVFRCSACHPTIHRPHSVI